MPRVLYLQSEKALSRLHHSRPRDLHRLRLGMPEVTWSDGAMAPLEAGERFDLLLIGALGHPVAKAYPHGAEFNEAALARVPKRVLMLHDVHRAAFRGGHDRMRAFIQRWIQYVIYANAGRETERILDGCRGVRRTFQLGNTIDMSVFRDHGEARDIDVLLYGQTDERHYPFRARLARLLPRLPHRTRLIAHPEEGGGTEAPKDEVLSRLINRSWLAIATPTRYKYLVAKYLEISASRTVIAGKIPRAGRELWRGAYVRLDESMSDEEIGRRIGEALADKKRLLEMADRMYPIVRERFSYERGMAEFREILEAIHQDRLPA